MRIALSKKKNTERQVVLLQLTWKEYLTVRQVVWKQVLQERARPVKVGERGRDITYKFHLRYLDRLVLTFPHAEHSPGVERLLAERDRVEPEDIPDIDIPGLNATLWPYQRAGVHFLIDHLGKHKAAFLNDEMGLGKTIQALSTMAYLDAFPALVVTPNSIKLEWAAQIDRFFPMLNYAVVMGNPTERRRAINKRADITLINYEALRLHPELKDKQYGMLVADEFHRIKTPTAKQTKAFHMLPAERKLLMSGTPLLNGRPEELWSPLKYCFPERFGNYYMFLNRHVIKNGYTVVGYRHLDEVKEFLQEHSLRRRKDQVLHDLPEKVYVPRNIQLTGEQQRLYDEIRDELILWLEDGTKKTINSVLSQITRLKQACFSPELYGGSQVSAKVAEVKNIMAELTANGEKAILFSQWSKATRILQRELQEYNPAYVDGSVNVKERVRQQHKFNNDDTCLLYIGTIGANKEGINLGTATYVIFTDKGWTPAENEQALSRSAAGGLRGMDSKVDHVHIIELIAENTIEQRIEGLLAQKRKLNNMMVETDGGAPVKKLTVQNIREIL